jgi:acetyltransferase-like isoleucine patch superfamily enzyme
VRVGAGALIGAGAVIRPGLVIGAGAMVGAGAAVVEDVAPGAKVMGVPARAVQPPEM